MLLAIDIGNSNITCGIFDGKTIHKQWRIETEKTQSEKWFVKKIHSEVNEKISSVVIGSVVPELDSVFSSVSQKLCPREPLFVSTKLTSNIENLSEKETALGADRFSDIVAAIQSYEGNKIIIDVGTATKFEVVSKDNNYLGGAISPGVGISFDALINRASKLSEIHLSTPQKVVGGFDTKEHLDSGFVFGFASMIDGMIERIKKERKWETTICILTGGFTDMLSPHLQTNVAINKTLTLEGLQFLWKMNT